MYIHFDLTQYEWIPSSSLQAMYRYARTYNDVLAYNTGVEI